MECPKKADFRYNRNLPEPQSAAASFGTIAHHAMQIYNDTRNLQKASAAFEYFWRHPEELGVAPEIWPPRTDYDTYRTKGLAALRAFAESCTWTKRRVLATEHKFLVPFGDHELMGYVDCIEITGGKTGQELRLTDYKTSMRIPYAGNLRQNLQITVYDYASRQPEFWLGNGADFPAMENGAHWWTFIPGMPRRNVWYALIQGKAVNAGERTTADFMRLYRVADEIQRALDHQVYVPNISGDSCGFCPYVTPCGLAIPPSQVKDDD